MSFLLLVAVLLGRRLYAEVNPLIVFFFLGFAECQMYVGFQHATKDSIYLR